MPKDSWAKYGKNWKYYKPRSKWIGELAKEEARAKKKEEQAKSKYKKKKKSKPKDYVYLPPHTGDYRYTKFEVYKETDQWKDLEKKVLFRDKHCLYCQGENMLLARHIHYKTYGRETTLDLECVCQSCLKTKPWKKKV